MLTINRRLSSFLDASRWIAAAAVISEHARILTFEPFDRTGGAVAWFNKAFYFATGFGRIAVVVFFVLSGFLVGGEVLRSMKEGAFSWRRHAARRVARLYPVYLLALAAGGAFDFVGMHHADAQGLYAGLAQFPGLDFSIVDRLTPKCLGQNLVFLQGLTTTPFGSNQPLWSIAFEAWYYLLFPLLLWPLMAKGASAPARAAAIAAAAAVLWFIRGEMLLYFSVWLVGMIPHALAGRLRIPWLASTGAFGILLVVARMNVAALPTTFAVYFLLAVAFTLCIVTFGQGEEPLAGGGAHQRLASFSYSLYANHWPLLVLAVAFLQSRVSWGLRMPPSPGAYALWAGLIVLCYGWAFAISLISERRTPQLREFLLGKMTSSQAKPPA